MIDLLIKLKIGCAYILSFPLQYIRTYLLKFLCYAIAVLSDKLLIPLINDNKIINVTYINNSDNIKSCTYIFCYLFKTLSIDDCLILDDLKEYIDFKYLIIDHYTKDKKIVKKIITHKNMYCDIKLNPISPIMFGGLTLND